MGIILTSLEKNISKQTCFYKTFVFLMPHKQGSTMGVMGVSYNVLFDLVLVHG